MATRIWRAPLWAHAVALAIVLIALVPLVGAVASFSADEGAAIVQAHHLADGDGDGWVVDHPLPQVDPDARAYPFELSQRGDDGTAPFVKHPLYALLLAGADLVGGHVGMVMLSLAGMVLAATLAGAFAGYLRPGLSRPSLWVTGLATPLLFDGHLVIAHTLGAAAAAGAALFAIRLVEGQGRRWVAVAGAAVCVVLAVLLRNEAAFWALGLAIALGWFASRRRDRALAVGAVAIIAAAGIAHFVEAAWIDRILGGHVVALGSDPNAGIGLMSGRVQSLFLTWFRPGYGSFPLAEMALVIMLGAVVTGAVAARRRPDDHRVVAAFAVIAAGAALLALVTAPANLVPGLLMTTPVVAAGLIVLRRSSLRPAGAVLGLVTFAVFALAVAATQYARGGSGEWGGRYFALGLPVLVPVVLLALVEAGARLDRPTRRVAAGGLAVCSLAMTVMGLNSLASSHRFTARLMATIEDAGHQAGGTDGRPVMIATSGAIPRLAWATFDEQRWLLSNPEDLAALVGRLRAAGIDRAVLVTGDAERDQAALGTDVEVLSGRYSPGGNKWRVVELRTSS